MGQLKKLFSQTILKRTNWLLELDLSDEYKLLSDDKTKYYEGVCRIRGKLLLLKNEIEEKGIDRELIGMDTLDWIIGRFNEYSEELYFNHSVANSELVNMLLKVLYRWGDFQVNDYFAVIKKRRCWIKTIF